MKDSDNTLKGKRLLILGCGYVGEALARQAMAQGMEVEALTRNYKKANALKEMGLQEVYTANLDETTWHRQTQTRYDLVVNCVSSASPDMAGYRQSYVGGMQSVVQWARNHLVHLGDFIYTSSTGVYPQGDGALVDEDAPLEGASERGEILREAERILRDELPCNRWFIFRLAGIYGEGRHYLLNALREGVETLPGSGEHVMNLIHREDVASALLSTLHASSTIANRIYNLSDNTHEVKCAMVGWLAQQLGVRAPQFDPSQATRRSVPNRRIDSRRVRAELGWEPRYPSYREGYTPLLNDH